MYLPNVIEYPIILHGAANLGGIITTLNPQCLHEELAYFLKISRAKYLVTTPSLAEKAFRAGLLEGIGSVFAIGQAENCKSVSSLLADDGTAFTEGTKMDPKEDVVALLFSSGPTGVSKGVMHTHYNLIAGLRIIFRDNPPLEDVDTIINVLPVFHIYGLWMITGGPIYMGNKIVLLPRFEPDMFLRAIQDYKVRVLSV